HPAQAAPNRPLRHHPPIKGPPQGRPRDPGSGHSRHRLAAAAGSADTTAAIGRPEPTSTPVEARRPAHSASTRTSGMAIAGPPAAARTEADSSTAAGPASSVFPEGFL